MLALRGSESNEERANSQVPQLYLVKNFGDGKNVQELRRLGLNVLLYNLKDVKERGTRRSTLREDSVLLAHSA